MNLPILVKKPPSSVVAPELVRILEIEVLQKNPRYNVIWHALSPLQQQHHQFTLQIGKLQLPVDPTYQPVHSSFQLPPLSSASTPTANPLQDEHPGNRDLVEETSTAQHHPPPPPPRLLRNTERTRQQPIVLESLASSYSSDEDAYSFGSEELTDYEEEDENADTEFTLNETSTDENEEFQSLDGVEIREGVSGLEVHVFLEDREEIGESDLLPIHLIAPVGLPRLQSICCIGNVSINSTRRWLLKNSEHDIEGLYQLFLTEDLQTLSLWMNTDKLQQQLTTSAPLHSRVSLFNILEQDREHNEWNHNNWTDANVKEHLKSIRNTLPTSQQRIQSLQYPQLYQIQWTYHYVSPIQALNCVKQIYMHTQQKRFFHSPSHDNYLKSVSSLDIATCDPTFTVRFRGVCLTHASGVGKKQMIADMLHSNGITNDLTTKVLILCFQAVKPKWIQHFPNSHVVTWETLHRNFDDSTFPVREDYYGFFRQLASEANCFKKKDTTDFLFLLTNQWNHLIVDNVVQGIESGYKNQDVSTKKEPWYSAYYPLYHLLQNIFADRVIVSARDFRPSTSKEVLAMGGLLQMFGDVPLLQQFRSTTPRPLLQHIMDHNLIGLERRNCIEAAMASQLLVEVAKVEMTLYEEMALTDLMHRYTSDPTRTDYGHVPLPELATILTVSSPERMMAHRDAYENKMIHTFQSAHNRLQHRFSQEGYHAHLLLRDQRMIATHYTHSVSDTSTAAHSSQPSHLRHILENPSNLVTEFTCTHCLETQPKKKYDYTISKCGHFVCWSCLSPWIQHQRWKKEDNAYCVPCMSCRIPLDDDDIIRYRCSNTVHFDSEESTKPYFAALERQHKRIALSKNPLPSPKPLYSAKVNYLCKYLRQKQRGSRKIVLFSQYANVCNQVGEMLTQERFEVLSYKGHRSRKKFLLETFGNKKNAGIVLLSISGESDFQNIDLSIAADAIVLLDNCYEDVAIQETVENAIIGRIHRANRTRPLHILRLLVNASQECNMYESFLRRQ